MNLQNTLALKKPQMASQWHPTMNGDLTPKDVACNSHKIVWWQCEKNPEHVWDAPVVSQRLVKTCPYCSGRRIMKSNSLAFLRPEVLHLWDYEKNDKITPEEIAPHSNQKVHWKCEKEHEWEISPTQIKNCPYCNNRKVDDSNSLETLHPHIAKEWHPHKNTPIKPSEIIPGSPKKVWWKCSSCNHEWDTTVRHRAERGTNCPECNKWKGTSFAEQSIFFYLKQIFPQAQSRYGYLVNGKKVELDIYIPEINLGIEYDGVHYHKSKKRMSSDYKKNLLLKNKVQLIRIREKGLKPIPNEGCISHTRTSNQKINLHESIQFILDYILTQSLNEKISEAISSLTIDVLKDSLAIYDLMNIQEIKNSLGTKQPQLVPYWDNEKNGSLTPFKVKEGNQSIVAWKCKQGHAWNESVRNVAYRQYACVTCISFGFRYPELLEKWDYKRNSVHPNEITPGSSRQSVYWICKEGHSYNRAIHAELKSKRCPYCTNSRVNKENCLQVVCPELVKEWHPTKNELLTPYDVSVNSRNVWWKCEEGHEWKASVSCRIKDGKPISCPKCREQSQLETTSLYAFITKGKADKQLLKEWDYERNSTLTPQTILSGSGKKVYWKCQHDHHWKATVYNRVNGKGNCKTCNSLGFCFPHLLDEWDYEKNKYTEPYQIAKKSSKKVWWKCKHGHSWDAVINSRAKDDGQCKTCQSIGFKHSILLKEWDYEKNRGINPFTIASGNQKLEANWKCKHGHEWIASPYLRSMGGNHCITCKSLGFLNPELAKEFHPTKNPDIDVMTIAVSSGKKIWWKCSHGHEWKARVAHRKQGTGCPDCPKGKVTEENKLANLFPDISKDWDLDGNNGYTPHDFTAFSSKKVNWKCHRCGHNWQAVIADRTRGWKKCQCCHGSHANKEETH